MLQYKRVGVTVKTGLESKNEAVAHVLEILEQLHVDIKFDPKRREQITCARELQVYQGQDDIDALLVVGGDGTILRAVRELASFQTPILCINRGRVGFLAEADIEEAAEVIPHLLNGGGVVEERSLLTVRTEREGSELHCGLALNEAVIAQGEIARLVDLATVVNGEPLTTYHADGLIIATPTGSTAYSLAAGGPIVHPGLAATILTPINPHSFSQKPIVVRGDSTVAVTVLTRRTKYEEAKVYLTMDGQSSLPLQSGDVVHVQMSPDTVKFLRRAQDPFFGRIREKLKWGERVD